MDVRRAKLLDQPHSTPLPDSRFGCLRRSTSLSMFILPKSGKYQDDTLVDAHLYYVALFKAMARLAAADRRGAFDEHIRAFGGAPGVFSAPRAAPDTAGRSHLPGSFRRRGTK